LHGSTCVDPCPVKFYGVTSLARTCEPCDATCYACSAGASTNCLSCDDPLFLEGNTCINPCPSNKYGDILDWTCKPCHNTCTTCDRGGFDGCVTCTDPLWFN